MRYARLFIPIMASKKNVTFFFRFFLHQQRKSAIGTGLRIAIMKRLPFRLRSLIPPLPDLHQWRGGRNARDAGVSYLAWGNDAHAWRGI